MSGYLNDRRASPDNVRIGEALLEASRLLRARDGSRHRAMAYRAAAHAIAHHPYGVRAIFARDGVKGLDAIPRVGLGIAGAVAEMLTTSHWRELEALRREADPVAVLQGVPGVGEKLARHIHDELHVDTLEALECAANDGRLERLAGVGPRRAAALRGSLDFLLRRGRRPEPARGAPPVEMLLEVDREYREKAAQGSLRTIAPRRFNPDNERWLPVLHARRGDWRLTALFSNTALAHKLGRTRDWVVIYYRDGASPERQCTVVTEARGPLAGRRVVRGREDECLRALPGGTHELHPDHAA